MLLSTNSKKQHERNPTMLCSERTREHLAIPTPCSQVCPLVTCPFQSSAATKDCKVIKKVLRSSQRKAQQQWNKTRRTQSMWIKKSKKVTEGIFGKFGSQRYSKQTTALFCEIDTPPVQCEAGNAKCWEKNCAAQSSTQSLGCSTRQGTMVKEKPILSCFVLYPCNSSTGFLSGCQ